MCFKRKKGIEDVAILECTIVEDRQLIKNMTIEMDVILLYAKDKTPDMIDDIKNIKELIKYLSPRDNLLTKTADEKLKDKIMEIKTIYTKDYVRDFSLVKNILKDLRILIAERDLKEEV